MKPAKNTLRDSPALPLLPCAWRDDRWVDVDTDIDAGAAAAVASVRRGDRFDSTRRIGFPTAATRALPIEKPRPETTILARIPRQIFGALADQRAHQFELAAPRLFRDGLLRLQKPRHARQIRRLLHLRARQRVRRVGPTQRR